MNVYLYMIVCVSVCACVMCVRLGVCKCLYSLLHANDKWSNATGLTYANSLKTASQLRLSVDPYVC